MLKLRMAENKTIKKDELFQDVTVAKTVSEPAAQPAVRPVAPSAPAASASSAVSEEPIEEWAVVVDDSPTVLVVLTGILKSLNIGVHSFRSPLKALQFMREAPEKDFNKISMVLSDFQMPDMNGLEFLHVIRSEAKLKHLPFVVVSGIVEKALLAQFASLGVTGYVVKPFKAQAIIDRIMQVNIARQKKIQSR